MILEIISFALALIFFLTAGIMEATAIYGVEIAGYTFE
jgi:hypothetical protein